MSGNTLSLDDIRQLSSDEYHRLYREVAKSKIMPTLGRYGLVAGGLGLTAAGIGHIINMRKAESARRKQESTGAGEIRLMTKQASLKDWADAIGKGTYAESPWHFPAFAPAAGATVLATGAGGYLLGSKLLNAVRSAGMRRELAKARRDYEQSLQPLPPAGSKEASERCELARDVDRIWESCQGTKLAEVKPEWARILGAATGLYLLAAGATAGYGAMRGFKSQRAGSKTKAVERARLEREQKKQQQQPYLAVGN